MTKSIVISMAAFLATLLLGQPSASAAGPLSGATNIIQQPNGLQVRNGSMMLQVDALTDRVLRIRLAQGNSLPENASWAVESPVRARRIPVTPSPDGFTTNFLRVRVDKDLELIVEDLAGHVILADAGPPQLAGTTFSLRKAIPQNEHYFGLGDKTGGIDRRGKSFVDWNTDAFGFSSADDPIYKSIPFFLGVGGTGGSYGLFLDNSWRTWFDFGHREDGVLEMGGPNGPIDYYFIGGPTTPDVVRAYTELTGKAPLAPRWALGYQQSRYSYESADELRGVAARLRAEHIPTDVLWLDIGYLDKNTPFTVNRKSFPDLKGLVADMGRDKFKVVTITDLHVAANRSKGSYPPYDSGVEGDEFVKTALGLTYTAPVWPGLSVFPDFTMARTRRWWGGLFQPQIDMGIAGSWNDMNEPAIFETKTKTMPLDVRHRIASDDFAPRTARHAEIHNVYGMQNTRATFEGLHRLAPDERPLVMTRASYAGGQRYAVTWTGDNSATWDHLKLSVQQIINLGLSGFSYSGADVSGFAGGPSADLLTRWFEIGAFYPIFRDHSATGTPRAEPWVDGPEHLAIRRRFIEERYRLMPYLYSLADQNARLGDPILRPVFYNYPSALNAACDHSWNFTLGASLLVAPPPTPESSQAYDICLPAGGWYDYWTGLPATAVARGTRMPTQSASQTVGSLDEASTHLHELPRLDRLPVFVRAGSILARQPLVQSTQEKPQGPLSLDVYPGEDCKGELYDDDGHSLAYARGVVLRQSIRCSATADGLRIDFDARQGKYPAWWRSIVVTVHDWTSAGSVSAGGKPYVAQYNRERRSLAFTLPDQKASSSVYLKRG